jgi:protein phosphatase
MKQVELHYGAASDVGLVRKVNEDSYFASPPIFVVADGMGGHDGGDVASAIVAEEFAALAEGGYDPRDGQTAIEETLASCQHRITDFGRAQIAQGKSQWYAGTTVVAALLVEDDDGVKWLLCNLGDSRIYRLAGDRLSQVSTDHSVVQELVDAGSITSDDAATHPERHVITRALGGPERADADYFLLDLPSVDRLLLCSDGISGMIDDGRIADILAAADDPRDAADQLVAAALAAGGRDNATALVVDVVGWSDEDYDSDRQRLSLETKLGALP